MKIVYVYADNPQEWNSSEWRCAVPARAFNRSHRHTAELISIQDFAQNTPTAAKACRAADVIVVQRNLFGPVLVAIQHWRAQDKLVVADFDDAYHLIPTSNASYPFWSQGIISAPGSATEKMDPPPLTQFKWGLRLVQAATVPSKRLADDWQGYTDMVYLPNYVDMKLYENVIPEPHERVKTPIIIGWGGSLSHLQSFMGSGALQALKRVCRARPQVRVMICGDDKRILNQLALPEAQKIHQPWVPYNRWGQVLGQIDIGIAPLSGAYDDRRSWIKVLEYMLMKIPWVASDSPAYHELRPYGWLVQNTPGSWERVLLDLIDHLDDYRQEAAGEPHLFSLSQAIDDNLDKIVAAYTAIHQQAG